MCAPPLRKFVAAATVLLIVAGGLVTSTESGLSVPDWPTSYGWNMFTFPHHMVGGIFYEHGHRLIASGVGILTIVLACWLWKVERGRGCESWGCRAGRGDAAGPPWWHHRALFPADADFNRTRRPRADLFLPHGRDRAVHVAGLEHRPARRRRRRDLRVVASATTALIYLQILVGATMRHSDAGLAIPDFPLVFGGLVPPEWTAKIAIHYAHRVGAAFVALAIVATAGHVWYHHRSRPELRRPAALLVALVVAQVTLGALVVLTGLNVAINTAHVVTGALVLATSLVLTLRSHRFRFADITTGEPAISHGSFEPELGRSGARA